MSETAYRFESCRGHLQAINGWPSLVKADGKSAPVAQLDRALDYGSRGWGFESSRAYSPPGVVKARRPGPVSGRGRVAQLVRALR